MHVLMLPVMSLIAAPAEEPFDYFSNSWATSFTKIWSMCNQAQLTPCQVGDSSIAERVPIGSAEWHLGYLLRRTTAVHATRWPAGSKRPGSRVPGLTRAKRWRKLAGISPTSP